MRQFAQKHVGMVVLFAAVCGFALGMKAGEAKMQYKLDVYKTEVSKLKGEYNDKATTARRGGNRVEGH